MDLWKTIFLYNPVVFRFHVNLPECMDTAEQHFSRNQPVCKDCGSPNRKKQEVIETETIYIVCICVCVCVVFSLFGGLYILEHFPKKPCACRGCEEW